MSLATKLLSRPALASAATVAILGGTVATASAATPGGTTREHLAQLRDITDKYHNIAVAQTKGWTTLFADVNGRTCIVDLGTPSMGGMGYHYVNPGNIGSTTAAKPAALVYRPGSDGTLHLAALEYLVVGHPHAQPKLFGHPFMWTPPHNRFMASGFWSLHVWIWDHNPSGTFAMWNPKVACPS